MKVGAKYKRFVKAKMRLVKKELRNSVYIRNKMNFEQFHESLMDSEKEEMLDMIDSGEIEEINQEILKELSN